MKVSDTKLKLNPRLIHLFDHLIQLKTRYDHKIYLNNHLFSEYFYSSNLNKNNLRIYFFNLTNDKEIEKYFQQS